MNTKEFNRKLEERIRKFAVSLIKLSAQLPNTPEVKAIRNQITKLVACVGVNYREAKPIFITKNNLTHFNYSKL